LGQTAPTIANVTNLATPTIDFPTLAPGSAAVIFGANLADSTTSAAPPWQSLLGGIEVRLVDESCYDTRCELVPNLTYTSPTQINFIVPGLPSTSKAWITRVVIIKNGQRFGDLTAAPVLLDAMNFESNPNPAIYDQPVTLTAHVSVIQGVPGSLANTSGSVNFMDGDTPLGLVKLSDVITLTDMPPLRRYDVFFTTSKLARGDHSIWASYSGDNNNNPANSGKLTQTVGTPELTILLSPNPSIHGNTVTMVATVSPSSCTGTMVFLDESDELGTVAVSAGRAQISTAALSVGNHPITVRYSGDGTCSPLGFGPANDFTYRTTSQTVW
jgi:hypothetical protein